MYWPHVHLSTVLATNVCKEFGVSYIMNTDAASHDTNPIVGIKKKKVNCKTRSKMNKK